MCELCVCAARLCRAFCLWVWPWSSMALCVVCYVMFDVCYLGYPVGDAQLGSCLVVDRMA